MTWPVHPIAEIFEVARGGSPRPIQNFLTDEADGLNWIMIGDATEGSKYISKTKKRIKPAGLKKTRMVYEGDFLLTNSMSFGHPYILKTSGCIHDGWLVLSPREKNISRDFFYYLLGSDTLYREFSKRAAGAVVKNLNTAIVKSVQIPLPPLEEQKRIAGILDAADALRAKRRESLAQLDTLLQSTFLEMFGDPVTNPMGWDRRSLGDITSIDAPMVDPTSEEYRGLLHYGPDRIAKDTGELLAAASAAEDGLTSGKFLCSPGEVLYSKIRPYLNKVALVEAVCLCSADVYPVAASPTVLTREYLWVLLRSRAFLDYAASFSNRANIPKLNRKQFAGYLAPVPPLPDQRRFAAIVDSIEQQKTRQRAHLAELDTLFASLQSRAFRGEL